MKHFNRISGAVALFCIVSALSGCGGSGGGSGSTTSQLIVSAGTNQTVEGARLVTLQAASNTTIASYSWSIVSLPSGSSLTLSDLSGAGTADASFTPDVVGNYVFRVKASAVGKTAYSTTTVKVDHIWQIGNSVGTSPGAQQNNLKLSIAPDVTPYLTYADSNNANKAIVKKYDPSSGSWVNVGSPDFSAGGTAYNSLAIAPDGTPYVAYQDFSQQVSAYNYAATVEKYDAGSNQWVTVGSPGFTKDGSTQVGSQYTSLAIAPDGTPYVAFKDTSTNQAVVEKYADNQWSKVGGASVSTNGAELTASSLAIGPGGTPYLAYKDDASGGVLVSKYDTNSSSWKVVGSASLPPNQASYISLAIAPSGTLYVSYQDNNNGGRVSVIEYNGSTWVPAGSDFSAQAAVTPSLSIASDGTPYIAYGDGTGGGAVVKKLDATGWSIVGKPGFSASSVNIATSIVVSADGTPSVAYGNSSNNIEVAHLTTIAPQTSRILAGKGANRAGSDINISARFDRAIDQATLNSSNFTVTDNGGAAVSGAVSYDTSTNTARFLPSSPLKGNVNVHLSSAIKDSSGAFFRGVTWSFHAPYWSTLASTPITADTTSHNSLAIAPDGTPYVAYVDNASGLIDIARFDAGTSSWNLLGISGLSVSTPSSDVSLAIAPDGTPYVAYQYATGGTLSVAQYSASTSWTNLNTSLSTNTANHISLAIASKGKSSGNLYVAYQDGNSSSLAVEEYTTSSGWSPLSSISLSSNQVSSVSLAIAPSGMPYVAYQDGNGPVRVKKYSDTGSSWGNVASNGGLSTNQASYISLAIAPGGTPYVAYEDGNNGPLRVEKYDSSTSAWSDVAGAGGLSANPASYVSLTIDSDGTPYVAYQDVTSGNAIVEKYDRYTAKWVNIGSAGFSGSPADRLSLVTAPGGTPYMAYYNGNLGQLAVLNAK